jgi:hypothetical protein
MTTALALYFLSLAILMVVYVLYTYLSGKDDLCSLRNVAILGFIIFQLMGAFIRLYTQTYKPFRISDPAGAATIFAIWATIFIILALLSYRMGWGVKWLATKVPVSRAVPGDTSLLIMAGMLAVMGLVIRFGMSMIPTFGALADYLGTGYASMAAGLCGWVWAKRFINPVVIVYTGVIVVIGFLTVMYSSFGRRGLIAVAAALLFGMYYGSLRKERPVTALMRLGMVGMFPLLFVALYTSVRSSGEHTRSAGQHLSAISRGGDLKTGLILLFEGQNVANEGFWLIENYPESFEYRWFFTLRYTVEVLIPREIYPSKPDPLSNLVAAQANIPKVNQDKLKMSPGIIGSAATEGGTIAVIVYAIVAGLFLRFFDQLCMLHPGSPFVIMPASAALGQVLGFARGETSVMVNAFILATIGCWGTMLVVGKFVEALNLGGPQGGEPPPDDEHYAEADPGDPDPYEEWRNYGQEPETAGSRA